MGSFQDTRTVGPALEQARQAALIEFYRNDDVETARALWEQQTVVAKDPSEVTMIAPRDPTEMAMLADIGAQLGLEGATAFIDSLREHRPGEADVLLATLRLQTKALPAAAAAAEAALVRFRSDPWTMSRYMERAVQIAKLVGTADASLARRMFDALEQPFAVLASEEVRLTTRAELTRQVDFGGLCRPAIGALEPHVPWTESFLRLRRDCYQAAGDPRLETAERDLSRYLAGAAQPILQADSQ
jgi:hypothetical protein